MYIKEDEDKLFEIDFDWVHESMGELKTVVSKQVTKTNEYLTFVKAHGF